MTTPLTVGEQVYLTSILANVHIFGTVTDGETPDQFTATLEIAGDNATMSLAVLVGPPGPAGQNAWIGRYQRSTISDPEDLPINLTDDDEDVGKYWIINTLDDDGNILGTRAYWWDGEDYLIYANGTPGPPGPVPKITPSVQLVPHTDPLGSRVDKSGNDFTSSWLFKLAVPPGPAGTPGPFAACPDVDFTTNPPEVGQVPVYNGTKWVPKFIGNLIPLPFTVPEGAFTNYSGLSTRAPIGFFAIPPQPFPWKPLVWGKIKAAGLELDDDPLIIGCEVRLGDPTSGQLLARGFGNTSGWANLSPHTSSPSEPNVAMTPTNTLGRVVANHTGPAGTVYVNLYNDGAAGVYLFNKTNAQLFIQVCPVAA